MLDRPLAYHITFGTYGMRLHGDERGTVDRRHNQPGEPVIGRNDGWKQAERESLRFDPIELSVGQCHHAEIAIPAICTKGDWKYHVAAAQPDHIHILLPADADGQIVRRLLKRWLSNELSKVWPLSEGQVWWAECGSVKWIWTEDYFRNVFEYIRRQRTISPAVES